MVKGMEWISRNSQRLFWFVFLPAIGYWAEGWAGFFSQVALIISLLLISEVVIPATSMFKESWKERHEEKRGVRITYVRIQKPHTLLIPLRIGGRIQGMTWKDYGVREYETFPEDAIHQAAEEFDGEAKVSHYAEKAEGYTNPPKDEAGWIEVVPERDFD